MTLANLVDDILLEIRNSNIGESEKINKKQIEQWCNNYRAYLIKKYIDDKKESLNLNEFTQYYTNVKVNKTTDSSSGHVQYIADIELPKLITTAGQQGIIKVTDAYGNILQIGNETKMKFQKYVQLSVSLSGQTLQKSKPLKLQMQSKKVQTKWIW